MVQRKDISTEDIIGLYQSGLIGREIATKLGCSIALVQQRLAKAGIKMRPSNERITVSIDKETIRKMYWDEKRHPRQIGEVFEVHKNTIIKKMLEFGIPFRTKADARLGDLNPIFGVGHSKKTKEKMSELFLTGERSLKPIKNNRFGKNVVYGGITFRSAWEYGFAVWLDKKKIPWEYEPHRLSYHYKRQKRTYIPDFYLPKGLYNAQPVYVEIKGFAATEEKYKIRSLKAQMSNLLVMYREDLVKLGIIDTSGKVTIK